MKTVAEILREYESLPEFYGMRLNSVAQSGASGDYPINVAVHRKAQDEVVALLEAGADPNARGELGYTPLHSAVINASTNIVELLLGAGARIDATNDDGVTPLQLARTQEINDLLTTFCSQPSDSK